MLRDVWIVGAEGGIGRFCCGYLHPHRMFTNYIDVTLSVEEIMKQLGDYEPSVLVYAAGVNHLDWSDRIDPERMLYVYNVNVVGLLRCIQAAPKLSTVVVIGSDAARRPMRTSAAYNASKAAVEAAVKCIARERPELRINVVAPGLIEGTAMTQYVYKRTAQLRPGFDLGSYMTDGIPAGRAGTVREVAEVVEWLVNKAPDYLTGSVIEVNGGR